MTLGVEEYISEWKSKYEVIHKIEVDGYEGGYPKIKIYFDEEFATLHGKGWNLKAIVKNAELNAGYKTGMAYNLLNSSKFRFENPILTLSGHPEVMNSVIRELVIAKQEEKKKGLLARLFGRTQ